MSTMTNEVKPSKPVTARIPLDLLARLDACLAEEQVRTIEATGKYSRLSRSSILLAAIEEYVQNRGK